MLVFGVTLSRVPASMTKLDFKKTDKSLYSAKSGRWDRVGLPSMNFLSIDGQGDPNGPAYAAALSALYPFAYAVKFAAKADARDFVVPPLEALWWADDPTAFTAGNRADWQWRAMLRMPEFVDQQIVSSCAEAVTQKLLKKGADPELVPQIRFGQFAEGDCLQTLHLGAYIDEAPMLADLHDRLMPQEKLTFNGPHHEIYLSNPRRVAPEKLRTILRQPVKSTG